MKQTSFSIQTLKSCLSHQPPFEYASDSLMKYELLIMKHEDIIKSKMNSTRPLTVEQELKSDCINEEHDLFMDEKNNSLKFI